MCYPHPPVSTRLTPFVLLLDDPVADNRRPKDCNGCARAATHDPGPTRSRHMDSEFGNLFTKCCRCRLGLQMSFQMFGGCRLGLQMSFQNHRFCLQNHSFLTLSTCRVRKLEIDFGMCPAYLDSPKSTSELFPRTFNFAKHFQNVAIYKLDFETCSAMFM